MSTHTAWTRGNVLYVFILNDFENTDKDKMTTAGKLTSLQTSMVPKMTWRPSKKLSPMMITVAPPVVHPSLGLMALMQGAAPVGEERGKLKEDTEKKQKWIWAKQLLDKRHRFRIWKSVTSVDVKNVVSIKTNESVNRNLARSLFHPCCINLRFPPGTHTVGCPPDEHTTLKD